MSIELIKFDKALCLGDKPNFKLPPNVWIAGGAIRQWIVGDEPKSDVDVFASSAEGLDKFVTDNLIGATKLRDQEHLVAYKHQGQLIQVIKYDFYPNKAELLDSFDFTVCQFVYDGEDIWTTTHALTSVLRKHLGVHKISPELAADSLRRAFKYQDKGYKPCLGTIQKLAESMVGLTKEDIKEQVQISPGGGIRIVGVD